jgi:serine phosphatase RsbU (regulator of sigma subunit)
LALEFDFIKMKKILFLFFYFSFLICSSQQNKNAGKHNPVIDSLFIVLKIAKEDTIKVNTLYKLCWELENIGEPEKAMEYANTALLLSQKINFKNGTANCYSEIGTIYQNHGNYSEALKNHFASLKIRESIGDEEGIGASYHDIGIAYKSQGNYPEALKNYFASLKISEEIGDKQGVASSYNSIGNIYDYQGNYDQALKNHFASLKIKEAIGDKRGMGFSYNGIGSVYFDQGNYSEALKNFLLSLKIRETIGNKYQISTSYMNVGNAYTFLGNYSEALKNHFASLKIQKDLGDKEGIGGSYCNVGIVLTKQKKYTDALMYLTKAQELFIEIGQKENLKETYLALTALDSARGNLKGAYQNYKRYILYKDSLNNEENTKKQTQIEMQYEFDKKESVAKAEQDKKDALTAEEKQKQKVITYSVSGGLILMFLLAGFIFRGYRQKQKANIVIAHQKELVEEKQKEIIDSINYAKRIQYTLLANQQLLNENLNQHFVFFQPKDIVSGDFYWATKKDNRFYLAVCDSTGHGVPGAFMSLLNISFLNEAITEKNIIEPHEILNHVRERLITSVSQDGAQDGMDGILLCFDNGKITYAAAHNAPALIKNKNILNLTADKMPIGKGEKGTSFTLHTIEARQGDTIYLYTDGYADQFGGSKGKKFKYKQLEELLLANCDKPMLEQKNILEKIINDWKGNLEQVDDILVIGIRI